MVMGLWSDGREAEGARLLSVYRDKIPIPGSNPGRSAIFLLTFPYCSNVSIGRCLVWLRQYSRILGKAIIIALTTAVPHTT